MLILDQMRRLLDVEDGFMQAKSEGSLDYLAYEIAVCRTMCYVL
jgi:hypothetical protein